MQNLYIIINPTGRMQYLELPESLESVMDYADFDINPVQSNDIRVRNLTFASNTVEMPREQFENLQTLIQLYQQMETKIQFYADISSQKMVNFLIRGILSSDFSQRMPPIFSRFPSLALAYQKKIQSVSDSLEQRQKLVSLRPKFVIAILEAYFDQEFVIRSASLSQEKFANASFFDGSTEFKVEATIDNVLIAVEHGYEFFPLVVTVSGTYSMIDGYFFDMENWQIQPDFKKYFDETLYQNKQAYVTKIISQSRMIDTVDSFNACLINIAEQFRKDEEKRHEGLPIISSPE